MKFRFALLVIVLTLENSYSQIGTVKIADPAIEDKYDSTKNFLKDKPDFYAGAILYLPGLAKTLRGLGYRDFKTRANVDSPKGAYKCCSKESEFNSNYDSLAGTNFKVLEVAKKKEIGGIDMGVYIFKLQNLKDNSKAYFRYDVKYEFSFPFIDMRYFEKVKANSIGKIFIVKENSFDIGNKITDVENNAIDSVWKYEWTCVDVAVEEKYFTLSLVLKNNLGKKMVFEVEDLNDEQFIIPFEKANQYKTKFKEFWSKVLQNKVALGMNEEMVRLAWGEPEHINRTVVSGAVSNQWIYKSGEFAYFTNGKVTAIQ